MFDIVCRPVNNTEELQESFNLRKKVFVEEQGLFNKTDRDIYDKRSIHIVALYNNKIVGTVRVYHTGAGVWYGSRLAVLKSFRGRVGKALIQKAMAIAKKKNAKHFRATVQVRNVPLFKRIRWIPIGPVILYRGQPHQVMEANLD